MRGFDATLVVINSNEAGALISMSEAGDYEKGKHWVRAKDLFTNKPMLPHLSTLIAQQVGVAPTNRNDWCSLLLAPPLP